MNIANVLATKGAGVITVSPDRSVREAVRLMVAHDIGALIVVSESGEPLGIITERHIVRRGAEDERLFGRAVGEVMTRDVVTGSPADELTAVAHTMTEKRIRHLPVLDRGRLVGIVSIGDVVKAERDRYQGDIETLESRLLDG